jgi:hypothetical protein
MEQELPGAMQAAMGVADQKWPHSMNALVWAEKFAEKFYVFNNEINGHKARMFCAGEDSRDECKALMIGWFANAIMAGYDTARARIAERAPEVLGQLAGRASMCWDPQPSGVFDSGQAVKAIEIAMSELL